MSSSRSSGDALTTVVTYDAEARASYQQLRDLPVAYTREMWEGVFYDFAADGSVVGIERLYA